jgi:hypothetical protein
MRSVIAVTLLLASVLASSPGYAAMSKDVRTKFISQCQKQMYMTNAQCSCMADIAEKKLDDLSIAYLSLNATDVRNSAAMSKKMTAVERNAIDKFMSTAPKQCKNAK